MKLLKNEMTFEEVAKAIVSKPISQGGMPKYMWEESFLPYIELIQRYLDTENIRMVFIKEL